MPSRTSILLVSLFMVGSGISMAEQPYHLPEWCSCEDYVYTVTAGASNGTVTVSPSLPLYPKGALVQVDFTPDPDHELLQWTGDLYTTPVPASIKANTLIVQVNGDTSVFAHGVATSRTFKVNYWDISKGSVMGLPTWPFETTIQTGDTTTLTATPFPGYQTFWQSVLPPGFGGVQYTDSITVKGRDAFIQELVVTFLPTPPEPEPMHSITVNAQDGFADIFTAQSPFGGSHAGPYLTSTTTGPDWELFAYRVEPSLIHALTAVTWEENGVTKYSTLDRVAGVSAGEYTAHLSKLATFKIEVVGQGVVSIQDPKAAYNTRPLTGGMQTEPPWATLPNPLPYDLDSNRVTLQASACTGWRFDRWEHHDGTTQEDGDLEFFMDYWPGPGKRLSEGTQSVRVKAVFVEDPVKVFVLSGFQGGIFASSSNPGWQEIEDILQDPSLDIEDFGMHHLVTKIPVGGCYGFLDPEIRNENQVSEGQWLEGIQLGPAGGGAVLEDLLNLIQQPDGPRRLALIGYSKGGGSVADLSHRLMNPWIGDPHFNAPDFPSFSIVFTGYIDAIAQPLSGIPPSPETSRPLASGYHSNLYTNVPMLWEIVDGFPIYVNLFGAPSAAPTEPNHEINSLTCVAMVDHLGIASCEITHETFLNSLAVASHGVLPIPFLIYEWCTVRGLSCP